MSFFRRLCLAYPSIKPNHYALTLKAMGRSAWPLGEGATLETLPMKHRTESIGVRVKEKKTIAFTGDTDYSKNLVSLANGVDLLVSECSFPDRKAKGHLNLSLLQKAVEKAKPGQVVLSHLYPEWEEYKGVLHAPFLLAEDGLEISL